LLKSSGISTLDVALKIINIGIERISANTTKIIIEKTIK